MWQAQYNMLNTQRRLWPANYGPQERGGVTLLEMVVVIAIVVILATLVIGIATNIDNQSRKQLTKSTIAIIDSALQQFKDYGYRYKANPAVMTTPGEVEFYQALEFPLDCNDMPAMDIVPILGSSLGAAGPPTLTPSDVEHDPNCSSSAVLYFFLSRVPQCSETLDRIDDSLITNKGTQGGNMMITADEKAYPFFRFLDAWQNPLRYDYYDETYYKPLYVSYADFITMKKTIRTFPLITSAGPDKLFGTADDITNR